MGSILALRPPQFSEDAAWLPTWLQSCDVEGFKLECFEKDQVTFEQGVEELQFLRKSISNVELSREEGGCDIHPLFLSGTDSSPFSCAQSAENVVRFQFHLSSDGNSENTTATTDVCRAESNAQVAMQTLENSEILGQKSINLSLFQNSGAIDWSSKVKLKGPVDKNELLKHEENVKFSEAATDAVELCIAASEALVINDVIKNDRLIKPSASAILEASIQMKEARLEVWKNTFGGSIDNTEEIDNLSDLDDTAMERAYEDAGIHVDELHGIELSISQVKDTLDSECDEKTDASDIDFGTNSGGFAHGMKGVLENDIQFKNILAAECFDDDTKKKVTENQALRLNTYNVALHNESSKHIQAQEETVCAAMVENNLLETNVGSSPTERFQKAEKDDNLLNEVRERFQSRWFGGWTWKNEMNCFTSVKHSIPKPFVGETSFFSESADVAPDENSSVKNHDKGTLIASQLSIASENFSNRENDEFMISQDVVKSSSASFLDPLCSVVPCSVSENACSKPATNHDDEVFPRHFNITSEHRKQKLLGVSASNSDLAQGKGTAMQISKIKASQHTVYRRFTSLRNYSTIFPDRSTDLEKNNHQKRSLLIDNSVELTFQETTITNSEKTIKGGLEGPILLKENISCLPLVANHRTHYEGASNCPIYDFGEEILSQTTLPEEYVKCLPSKIPKWGLLKCQNHNDKHLPPSKRVRFSKKETNNPDTEKLQKVQTASKICCSTRAAKKPTGSSPQLELKYLNRFRKNHLDKEKKRLIFQHMEFMLTGFSRQKEKEIESLIREYGGIVLSHIPSRNLKGKRSSRSKSQTLPIVLCLKKMPSVKLWYGCAVNSYVLKVNWLMDSIVAGFVLPPKRYMVISRNIDARHSQVFTAVNYDGHSLVFNNLGIMLHGKSKMLTNISTIIQHGGGRVFKTLQKLVQTLESGRISMGVVVADDDSCASRHLKHCASEKNVPMTSVHWVTRSLYAGQLIPLKEKKNSKCQPAVKIHRPYDPVELSQEI